MPDNREVLPRNIIPTNYDLWLKPNLESFKFDGKVKISLDVLTTTSKILLNATELEIQSITVENTTESMQLENFDLDENSQILSINLSEPISTGEYFLNINYRGNLNDRLHGFYKSSYINPEGEEAFLAATQFESTFARRAFPCWDEPNYKSTFNVTLQIESKFSALSNMPVAQEFFGESGWKSITYDPTPKMSTYLLAFIIGDLAHIEQYADNGTLMRIWTTRGNETQGEFALETSVNLLTFFNEYFGIPYPLPKMDHIALPDFAAGAMENWGAITYREAALLVDPKNTSASTKQRVASIISHEMAHMWFGDLVTMDWWNDLWLNESFASWMGDKAVDAIHPEWEVWTEFLNADTGSAFSLDSLKNSHPIEQEVNNPDEIGALFDAISYSKGGSVLRMLEDYLGAKDFRKGINLYLTKHSYQNAQTQDLWNSLAEVSGKPVSKIMDSWVKQTGFPVIDFDIDKNNQITINQKRFLFENISKSITDTTTWAIPVKACNDSKSETSILMESATDSFSTTLDSSDKWIKINPDQTGFYRVNYSDQQLLKLQTAIQRNQIPARDRLGIQGDAFALSRAGYSSPTRFLTLAKSFNNESDASVLSDLSSGLRFIENLIESESYHKNYKSFCEQIYIQIADSIGWYKKENEGHLDSLLRSTALGNLGHYGNKSTINKSLELFQLYCRNSDEVHPDIRGVIFNITAQNGDTPIFNQMLDLERKVTLQEEKVRLHGALANFSEKSLLNRSLEISLSGRIRAQDSIRIIVGVSSSQLGRSIAWDFIRENWTEIDKRYGDGGFALNRLVSLVSGFSEASRIEEIEKFFDDNPTPAAARTIQQALERIYLNIAWKNKFSKELSEFLK
jgi:puromycin-sensitive aminopeptidase